MSIPVLVLAGRPNVGKSTLFNRLTQTRDALVANQPGLTRDRQYGICRRDGRHLVVVDTGGLLPSGQREGIQHHLNQQVHQALAEADTILFMVDARSGPISTDFELVEQLRRFGKPVVLLANKSENLNAGEAGAEFHALGLGQPLAISATHGQGIRLMLEWVTEQIPNQENTEETSPEEGIRVVMLGRPNVGKSTLINRMLGENRLLVFDRPGTTRDSIAIPFERDNQIYTLIDTAGVRRRARVTETIERFSVIKTLQALESAHVAIMVLDAHEGIGEQDARLLGYILDSGRGLLLAINKWDGMPNDQRHQIKEEISRKLGFVDFASQHYISALHGSGVGKLYPAINRAYRAAYSKFPTPTLTQILERSVQKHAPPLVRGRRIRLRYAHQGGSNPPCIVIHGKQTERLSTSYKRYLNHCFRKELDLFGTPLQLQFKTGSNPYEGKRNRLTPRQERKRKRLLQHVKRR